MAIQLKCAFWRFGVEYQLDAIDAAIAALKWIGA
jgi:hypothetical protein